MLRNRSSFSWTVLSIPCFSVLVLPSLKQKLTCAHFSVMGVFAESMLGCYGRTDWGDTIFSPIPGDHNIKRNQSHVMYALNFTSMLAFMVCSHIRNGIYILEKINFISIQQMHYTFFHWFLAPSYVLAYLVPSFTIFNTSNCFSPTFTNFVKSLHMSHLIFILNYASCMGVPLSFHFNNF
jgi:hypothetical protein